MATIAKEHIQFKATRMGMDDSQVKPETKPITLSHRADYVNKLFDVMRKKGVKHLKLPDGTEIVMHETAPPSKYLRKQARRREKADRSVGLGEMPGQDLSAEDVLMWSSTPVGEL